MYYLTGHLGNREGCNRHVKGWFKRHASVLTSFEMYELKLTSGLLNHLYLVIPVKMGRRWRKRIWF